MIKEIKEDLNKRRGITHTWIGKCNIVNVSIHPKLIYRFNIIPIKSQQAFWVDIDTLILKFIWKGKNGYEVGKGTDYKVRVQGDCGGDEAVSCHVVVMDTRFYALVKTRITLLKVVKLTAVTVAHVL